MIITMSYFMEQRLLYFLLFFSFIGIEIKADVGSYREIVNLNREWTYKRGDYTGAQRADYDDSSWEFIGLPHSFSIPYFMSKDFYTGYGWYRKQISLSKTDLKKEIFLEFDGVFQEAEIYVNGQLAGVHRGGYTGFNVCITPYIVKGDNVIAVRVNNIWQPDIAPRGGEHVFSGGIYRNVRLVKKNPVHIDWYGTFVTTPTLEANAGKTSVVRTQTEIRNSSDKVEVCKLEILVKDEAQRVIAKKTMVKEVPAWSVAIFDMQTDEIQDIELWHPSDPYLYTLESRLYKGRKIVDCEKTIFGFRWFRWTSDKGFYLNGKHFFFRGANVHQDQAGWGDAVTDSAMRRDVKMMKEAGFDMIRGSHYPHAPAFADACDREGVLFWSEAPFWGTAGPKVDGGWTASAYPVKECDIAGFERNVLQQLEEMIRINRNHPSIFVWSVSNEPFFTDGKTIPGVKSLLKKMVDKVHELDPTRLAAVGGAQRPLGDDRIDKIGDIAGYNGDGANIVDFQKPGLPSVVTEYGSTTADRPGKYAPGWGDLSRDEGWKGREWRSGQAIWCGFDHGSIFGPRMGKMGIVDYFRLPKRSWYWYRNEYSHVSPPAWPKQGEPARIQLKASKYERILADGTDDVQLIITILDDEGHELSNSPDIHLRVLSGPGEFPTGKSITFSSDSDIRIMDGKAAIALRAYYAGKTVVEASSDGLLSGKIELEFIGAPDFISGKSREVDDRPYVRFVQEKKEPEIQTYGVGSPTFASSSSSGHSPGFAADGDELTTWQPKGDDAEPYLTLDVERTLVLREIRVVLGRSFIGRFEVDVSLDGVQWSNLVNADSPANGIWSTSVEKQIKGRFIRFLFPQDNRRIGKPTLAEIIIKGYIAD